MYADQEAMQIVYEMAHGGVLMMLRLGTIFHRNAPLYEMTDLNHQISTTI